MGIGRLGLSPATGESAILLARDTRCRSLLIFERRGRQIARRLGIPVVGLTGVLLAATQKGLLEFVAPELAALTRYGYRLSDALGVEVLSLAG